MESHVFPDNEFANDWHVEMIDTKTGDIYQAVFSGPDSEERAREYAQWQQARIQQGRRAA